MHLHDAKLRMARLMVDEADHWQKVTDAAKARNEAKTLLPGTSPIIEWTDEEQYAHDGFKRDRERFGQQCAADPAIREHLAGCWMVDISGYDNPEPERLNELLESRGLDIKGFVNDLSSLGSRVRAVVEGELDIGITDSGAGCGGWDMGVPCDDRQARQLCDRLYKSFAIQIAAGALTVTKKFWGWHFPEMRGWDEAEKFLEAQGVN